MISRTSRPLFAALLAFAAPGLAAAVAADSAEELKPGAPVAVPGTHGRFDFIVVDPVHRRLLAAHPENGSLEVIDLKDGALVKSIATGAAQACVADAKGEHYYVSVSKPPQLVVVDATRLEVTAKVPLSGPADLLAWHEASGTAYVCHDDARELWAVSPAAGKVTGTVALPGDSPEDLRFDPAGKRLFQAMKNGDTVAVIDVATGKVQASWSTAPAKAPHGMVLAPEADGLLIAGGNGKLVLMSQKDGRILASADIPQGVDEIAYDAGRHRVYGASGQGKISVHGLEEHRLTSLGTIPSSAGAHSIAVDPQTHTVWIAYAKEGASYVQPFTPRP